MKRTALLRKAPLKRGTKRMERTRLAPKNAERAARLHTAHFGEDGAYAAWLRTLECSCGCGRWERDRMACHHVKSRGAGGTIRDLVVLHWTCHERGHTGGWKSFERERGVDLQLEADRLTLRWLAWTADRAQMRGPDP